MNDRTVLNVLRDTLRYNLEDPLTQWGKSERQWIHTDKPLQAAQYPRIQINKRTDTEMTIISMGFDYIEQRLLSFDIWFWTKAEFKWNLSDETLKNEELVKEYQELIQNTVKAKGKQNHDEYKIYLKVNSFSEPVPDESGQFYLGRASGTILYFKNGC